MKQFFQTLPWKLARLEFYKKKPFAVTCTVIFSVLLAFDLAVAVFMPSANSFTGMQGFDASDFEEFMDSTEFGDASDSQSGSSDSDSGSSSYSGGMPSGDMPSDMGDFDMGDMPEDFDMDDLPEDFDMEDMGNFSGDMSGFSGYTDSDSDDSADEDSDSSSSGGGGIIGFLRGVKSHWVLLAVVFAILDGLSIARLVILSRRLKKEREEEAKIAREKMLAGQIVYTNRPVKKIKKTNPAAVWAIPMVGVLLLVVIVNALSAQSSVTVESTSATVYSGSAETTSLDTVLSSAGILEEEDAESLELNSTVEVSTWYVSNGDTVEEGDTLAAVDKVSVMSAIASLQEQMDELDEQLAEYESEEIDDTITAASDGRVMAIYAEEGTSVVDTMYDCGALLLLSIDGYLAVDVETDVELQTGDSVTVILSDDSEVTGKVGNYLDGTAVILVSDEDASLGEDVSVETEDGDEIGSGALYIHNQLAVTGYLGTVDEISVEVGDEVENGDTLLTLTDTEYTGTYETLLAQRSDLEDEMQELFTLYQDPYLYASCAGVVSVITDDTSSDSSSTDDSDSDSSDDSDSSSSDDNSSDSDSSDSSSSDENDDSTVSAVDDNTVLADSDAVENEKTTESEYATATVCTVSSSNTSSALTASSDTSGTAVTTSTSSGYDNYIGVVQSTDSSSATAAVAFLTGVYEISDYSDLSNYDLSTDNLTESYTIDMNIGTIMFTYSSSGLALGTAADIAAGDILVISYESGGSPGLGSTPIWIVRVVEDSSEEKSSDTESDSEADTSASESDTESDASSSGSDSSSTGSGSDSSSTGSGSDSSSTSSDSDSSSTGSGSDSSSTGSGSDSTSGSSGTGTESGSASGSTATGSDNADYGAYGSSTDSATSSADGSGYSNSTDSDIIMDGTINSTDQGSLYSDSSEYSDTSNGSSAYSSDSSLTYAASDLTDLTDVSGSTVTDGTDAAGESDALADSSSSTAYTVNKTTMLEITPQDTMTITITIDELDILSLEVGQTAQVTLDAFPGQSFEGEVTAIDLSGTNSGGSTKFTAEVTINREDDMLAGMNASAVITIDTTDDVLCIPEDALVETDGVCYVYTTYDEKTDELGGLVEVTTGLSDGENVEILSGLGEGDSYYYSILDVVNYSTSSASSGSSFSMDSLFSSGGMGGR